MGLLECASYLSTVRGYDYFKGKTVQNLVQISQDHYHAAVSGTTATPYEVFIDIAHPRKSKCNCPHANGTRIVCKHMIAVYFTAFPDEAQRIYETKIAAKTEDTYDEWDDYEDEENNRVIEYVCEMKKSELQQALLQILFDGPQWQLDCFIEEHDIDIEDA